MSDGLEINVFNTAPHLVDTDDDGTPDNVEIDNGSDPANALSPIVNRAFSVVPSANDSSLGRKFLSPNEIADWNENSPSGMKIFFIDVDLNDGAFDQSEDIIFTDENNDEEFTPDIDTVILGNNPPAAVTTATGKGVRADAWTEIVAFDFVDGDQFNPEVDAILSVTPQNSEFAEGDIVLNENVTLTPGDALLIDTPADWTNLKFIDHIPRDDFNPERDTIFIDTNNDDIFFLEDDDQIVAGLQLLNKKLATGDGAKAEEWISIFTSDKSADLTFNSSMDSIVFVVNPIAAADFQVLLGTVVVDDYLLLPNQNRFELNNFTLEAWIRPDAVFQSSIIERVVSDINDSANEAVNYRLGIDGAGRPFIMFTDITGASQQVTAPPAVAIGADIPLNAWTHLAASFDSTARTLTLLVNGNKINTERLVSTAKTTQTNGAVRVGRGFSGFIDEIRVWNRERSETELQSTLNSLLTGNEQGLISYFRFDDSQAIGDDSPLALRSHEPNGAQEFVSNLGNDWLTGWSNAGQLINGASFVDAPPDSPIMATESDTDGDGLSDDWERLNFGNLSQSASGDPDGDGLRNLYEELADTNPNLADSDGDGISDGNEDVESPAGDGVTNLEETGNSDRIPELKIPTKMGFRMR